MPQDVPALTTPEQINAYRLLAIRSGLRLESKGIRVTRGVSCRKIVREEFGIRFRDIEKVRAAFDEILREKGVLRD